MPRIYIKKTPEEMQKRGPKFTGRGLSVPDDIKEQIKKMRSERYKIKDIVDQTGISIYNVNLILRENKM